MRLGLIARSDPRGLGNQTRAVYDNLRPERTLVVDMGDLGHGYPTHHAEWYPDGLVVSFDGFRLPELTVRSWLEGLDVVYTAETPYDHQLPRWCRQHGVALVVHVNPEFDHWGGDPTNPHPEAIWSATSWRLDKLPKGARVVPMPVATDRIASGPRDGTRGFLHVVGRRALADRNGTTTVMHAWRAMRKPQRWTITTQDRMPMSRPPRHIDLHLSGPLDDPWDLYELGDVLVIPRRYGGLCLPAQEAMARGLAVVMPDCPPNPQTWPVEPVRVRKGRPVRTAAGMTPTFDVPPRELAMVTDRLTVDPEQVQALGERSLDWARAHTWEALTPVWLSALEEAVDRAAVNSC